MILTPLSTVYGAAATWRRRWYARDPQRRKRLSRPVVSVGNLRVGGAGKTPIVSSIARLLLAAGQRPAVLTRGYGRRVQRDGVTIVSDGRAILEDVVASMVDEASAHEHRGGELVELGELADRIEQNHIGARLGVDRELRPANRDEARFAREAFGLAEALRLTRCDDRNRRGQTRLDSPEGSQHRRLLAFQRAAGEDDRSS